MSSVLDKIKSNIDKNFVKDVDISLIDQMQFLPIMKKGEIAFVAINSQSSKEEIINSSQFQNIKFIQLSDEEYEELSNYISSALDAPSEPQSETGSAENVSVTPQQGNQKGNKPKKRLGEILISKGWLTEVQLIEALAESKRQEIPLGSMLCKLEYVTLDQLKDALHEQQGFDLLDTQQIQIQEKVVNILPEDFIKANKVIPISSDNGVLIVGMVNPNDTKVLKDIPDCCHPRIRNMSVTATIAVIQIGAANWT